MTTASRIILPSDIAKEVRGSESDLAQAVAGLSRFPYLVDFTKQIKLDRLRTRYDCTTSNSGVYSVRGDEWGETCYITLNLAAGETIELEPWEPGNTSTVSHGAPMENYYSTLLTHELGHHVDNKLVQENKSLYRFTRQAAMRAFYEQNWITGYASVHPDEYFAETFAAYLWHPEDLKAFDPMGYEAIRQTGL